MFGQHPGLFQRVIFECCAVFYNRWPAFKTLQGKDFDRQLAQISFDLGKLTSVGGTDKQFDHSLLQGIEVRTFFWAFNSSRIPPSAISDIRSDRKSTRLNSSH